MLSTISGMPWRCAISASAAKSVTLPAGLPTDSQKIARVFASINFSNEAGSRWSANFTVRPYCGKRVREQVVGAAVERGGADHVLAGLGDGLKRVGDGRLTGGQRQRADPALECRDALLEHVGGRVHDARVDVARDLQVEEVRAVLGVVERVGGGLVDRHRHRLGGGVGRIAGVHDEGFELHGGISWSERGYCPRSRPPCPRSRLEGYGVRTLAAAAAGGRTGSIDLGHGVVRPVEDNHDHSHGGTVRRIAARMMTPGRRAERVRLHPQACCCWSARPASWRRARVAAEPASRPRRAPRDGSRRSRCMRGGWCR